MPETLLLCADGRVITDEWIALDDEAPLSQGKLLVGLARWQAESEAIAAAAEAIGVRIPNTADVEALTDTRRWSLIALEFPKFTDGRAYSQARLLRERLGFGGELRATGEVLRDQLFYMRRCGFDRFEIAPRYQAAQLAAAFDDFSTAYQPTGAA